MDEPGFNVCRFVLKQGANAKIIQIFNITLQSSNGVPQFPKLQSSEG
jgi:hypothetical protein